MAGMLLALLVLSQSNGGDTLAPDTASGPRPVHFTGKRLHYDAEARVVYLEDSAWVQTGDVTLQADTTIFWQEPQIVHSHGNFTLTTGQNITRGDSLKYNIRTGRGLAYTSRAFVDKGWVRGSKIYKLSRDELCLESGDFTTCEELPSHYTFVAYRMRVLREDIAVVWPLVFKIRDIPVAVAPFWFFPIKKHRSSGFLTPRVGYHSTDGKYFRNVAYYWVLNNYMDFALGTDLLEKRGPRFFSQMVYRRYRSFSGNMLFTYANDIYEDTYRWSVDGVHSQSLLGFDIGAQASWLSDVDYRQDYSEDKTEFLRSESYSYLSLYRAFGPAGFTGTLDRREDLIRGSLESNMPSLDLSLATQTLGPFNLSGSSSFRRYAWRDTTGSPLDQSQAAVAELGLDLPQMSLFRYFHFIPGISGRAVWFDFDSLGRPNPTQLSSSYSLSGNTALYGLSEFQLWHFTKFLHTITPTVSLSYTPKPRELDVSPVAGIGPASENLSVSYGISNTWDGKWKTDTTDGTKVQLASVSLSQKYDFLADSAPFSDVGISGELFPGGSFGKLGASSRASASYGVYDGKLRNISLTTSLSFSLGFQEKDTVEEDTTEKDTTMTEEKAVKANQPPAVPWSFSLSHTYSPPSETDSLGLHSLAFSVKGNLTRSWIASYSMKYDLVQGKVLDQSLSLKRDLHCWRMDFSWNTFGTSWVYNLSFVIKNLPDIELKRGFFDLFLPR